MAKKLSILEYPDEALTSRCSEVTRFDQTLTHFVDDLIHTLRCTPGIGLSAPQVGNNQRIFVMDLSSDNSDTQVYINPELIDKSGFAIADEACLSLPGVKAKVIRSAAVAVRAYGLDGLMFERELQGMFSICFQHELDHLEGTLFIDRVSAPRSWLFRSRLAELERTALAV